MKTLGRAFVVAFLGVFLVGGSLSAHNETFDSDVTIDFKDREEFPLDQPDYFFGKVRSDRDPCLKDRKVKVFARTASGRRVLVGTDMTNANGVYRVEAEDPGNGNFFARLTLTKYGDGEIHVHRCTGDNSDTIHVNDDPGPVG